MHKVTMLEHALGRAPAPHLVPARIHRHQSYQVMKVIAIPRERGQRAMSTVLARAFDPKKEEWRGYASCRDMDPDLFFPVGTTGAALDQIEASKSICNLCEVREDCLDFALSTNQESGVWGGTSEEERRTLRRQWLAARRKVS